MYALIEVVLEKEKDTNLRIKRKQEMDRWRNDVTARISTICIRADKGRRDTI